MLTLKVISLYQDDGFCRDVELSLAAVDGLTLDSRRISKDLARDLKTLGESERADVLICELNGALDEAQLEAVETELARLSETIAVFVSFAESDIKLMRHMIRIGVRDVLPQPVDRDDLINQVTTVLSEKRERMLNAKGSLSSVYSFIAAKGGSGTSTLAVNVAVELARRHKLKVALIDLDLQLGVCDMLLDITPKSNVYDAISQSHRVDAVFIKALMTTHASGLDVLPSPGQLTSVSEISVQDIHRVLDAVAEAYEVVILDVPNFFVPWTIEALKMSERVMLVVQNELSTIKDAKTILDNLPALGVSRESIEVVSNRAMSKMASVSIEELKHTLGVKRAHRVRTDFQTSSAAHNQGKPLGDISGTSHMTKDVINLANYLSLCVRHPGEDPSKHKARGLWKRMVGR